MLRKLLLILAVFPCTAAAIEISTGKLLGLGYEERSFYVRDKGGVWTRTYAGSRFRPEAAGRLMNLRIAQGIFEDEWLSEFPFDPEENSRRLIQALDIYKDHGVLAINVSLQGGNPGYGREVAAIRRQIQARQGPGKGALISAFRPDGSLKESWMNRLLRLIRELDRRQMILDLMLFYQGQDEVLESPAAIERGVRNAVDWLIANDCRNVIVEIANEHDVAGFDQDRYIHSQIGHLIQMARSRFRQNRAPFQLPVSASTGGRMQVFDGVRDHADLVLIHGNQRTPEEKGARVAQLVGEARMPGPILMNEDDNGRDTTPQNLAKERASCDAVFGAGGSWGYMPWRQVQMFPFRYYLPGPGLQVEAGMAEAERDPAYFHAVLEHIRKTVLQRTAATLPCNLASRQAGDRL